jgi:hypothetical protein
MRKVLMSLTILSAATSCAFAAQLVLPSVVVTAPVVISQTPVCTKTAPANLVAPVAAGTVAFSCVVPPTGWTGAVQFSDGTTFGVTPLAGNTFNVVFATAVTTAQTFPVPGTITTTP